MASTSTGGSPFLQRWLYFALFGGTALLAATVVTQGLQAAAPAAAGGANGLAFVVTVHALAGATLGALAAFRLRAGGTADESVNLDALALGVSLALGALLAAGLTPFASTPRMRGALAIWPIAAVALVGAAVAARRGGQALPAVRPEVSRVPLGVGEQAAAQQALALLDELQRFHDRLAEPDAARPDVAETERFFETHERYRDRCGRMSSGHAAVLALHEAGDALVTAAELRYVARGWHADLAVEPGDAEGIAAARRAWDLAPADPLELARQLGDRARRARQEVEGFVASARTAV